MSCRSDLGSSYIFSPRVPAAPHCPLQALRLELLALLPADDPPPALPPLHIPPHARPARASSNLGAAAAQGGRGHRQGHASSSSSSTSGGNAVPSRGQPGDSSGEIQEGDPVTPNGSGPARSAAGAPAAAGGGVGEWCSGAYRQLVESAKALHRYYVGLPPAAEAAGGQGEPPRGGGASPAAALPAPSGQVVVGGVLTAVLAYALYAERQAIGRWAVLGGEGRGGRERAADGLGHAE